MEFQTIGLIGPPNVGKSTLFNRLTGLRQKVSNFSGVTVEHRSGRLRGSGKTVIDLPGVWTLTPSSEDQKIAVSILQGGQPSLPKLDAVLLVVDGTQFHRYSLLIGEVLACKLPTMLLINMADELEQRKGYIDPLAVARELRTPTALISAARGTGIDAVDHWLKQDHAPAHVLPVLQAGGNAARCEPNCNDLTAAGAYRRPEHSAMTRAVDRWALHPVAGPILCLIFLLLAFQVIFRVAYPAGQALTNWLGDIGSKAGAVLPDTILRAIVVDGIWNGIASILGFLPQILCMFVVITVLEDSGYMARAAVIADRTMGRVGLNGRSFLPLLSAYACAVPAIMATRAIPSKRDRIATILIAPFMTCSARLPVYALLIAAFIPARPVLGGVVGLQALTMLALYVTGLLAALLTALLLRSSVMRGQASAFAIELPNYRMPRLRTVALALVDRSKVFLKQVATVILVLNLIVWFLAHLPLHNGQPSEVGSSILARIGSLIEPLLHPLGFNRPVGISLLTAFVARESVVSTLSTLYNSVHPGDLLRADIGLAGALALMVFFALAMQCTATLAVVRRETNSWTWPVVQFAYMTVLAYCAAFVTYRVALLFHL